MNSFVPITLTILATCLAPLGCVAAADGEEDTADSVEQAHSSWCSPPNPADTYDFYPGTGAYPLGNVSSFPWPGEAFESYADGATVECSSGRAAQSHLEVTSGCLLAKRVGVYRRGFVTTPNFRVLARGLAGGKPVKWQAQTAEARFNVASFQEPTGSSTFQGVHLFARYRTENDLYVASLRKTGEVLIQKKLCGTYTALARGVLRDAGGRTRGQMATGTWYRLKLAAVGSTLTLSVDDVQQLQVTDTTFSWGTSGIRTDFANVYIDDWTVR